MPSHQHPKFLNKVSDRKAMKQNEEIFKRILVNSISNCCNSLNDSKPKFVSNLKDDLLNPAKKEFSKINKLILDEVNCYVYIRNK